MDNHIKCTIESEVFGGFICMVDKSIANTIEEALIFTISALYGVLQQNNLNRLLSYAKLRNFKVKTYNGIPYSNPFSNQNDLRTITIVDSTNFLDVDLLKNA